MTEILQILNPVMTALLSILVGRNYRKISRAKAYVMGMGFFVVGFYVDVLFELIMQGFLVRAEDLMQFLGFVISKSILITAWLGLKVSAKEEREKQGQVGADKAWHYLHGLTLAISAFFLLLGMAIRWQNGVVSAGVRIVALLVLLTLLAGYYITLFVHLQKQTMKVAQTHEENRRHEAEVYLENVENNYQRTRELWHDLKNHINLMNLLLQDEKYGELKDYLRIFNEDVDSLTLPVKTGNLIVDALLSDKVAKAKREKIEVSLELCNLIGLKCKPDEICGLLGNLLDNALEANRHLREGRSLEVTCKELEECYYIRVRNPVSGDVSRKVQQDEKTANGVQDGNRGQEFLQTNKTDLRNQVGHGLGLRSVERIVHGCGGEMAVDHGEKYFTVVVRLPR